MRVAEAASSLLSRQGVELGALVDKREVHYWRRMKGFGGTCAAWRDGRARQRRRERGLWSS